MDIFIKQYKKYVHVQHLRRQWYQSTQQGYKTYPNNFHILLSIVIKNISKLYTSMQENKTNKYTIAESVISACALQSRIQGFTQELLYTDDIVSIEQ